MSSLQHLPDPFPPLLPSALPPVSKGLLLKPKGTGEEWGHATPWDIEPPSSRSDLWQQRMERTGAAAASNAPALHQAAEKSAHKACLRQRKPVTTPAHPLSVSKPVMVGDRHN